MAESLWLRQGSFTFPVDRTVDGPTQWHVPAWQATQLQWVGDFTHVLSESGSSLMGGLFGLWFDDEADYYRRHGIVQGLVFHGSDVRNPARHAERERWSPFADPDEPLTEVLQRQTDDIVPRIKDFAGPLFVSTPDLLLDLPDATWLPVTVDAARWAMAEPPFAERRARPRVVHTPSSGPLKGSAQIDVVAQEMHDEGIIEYHRLAGVSPEEVFEAVRGADIVLDQFAIGSYGVAAVEAMAAGRVVIGHISEQVRAVAEGLPILEADAGTLRTVIESLLDSPESAANIGADGPRFVGRWHDGGYSAGVLGRFLDDGLDDD
jgi:hypothetical protein